MSRGEAVVRHRRSLRPSSESTRPIFRLASERSRSSSALTAKSRSTMQSRSSNAFFVYGGLALEPAQREALSDGGELATARYLLITEAFFENPPDSWSQRRTAGQKYAVDILFANSGDFQQALDTTPDLLQVFLDPVLEPVSLHLADHAHDVIFKAECPFRRTRQCHFQFLNCLMQ